MGNCESSNRIGKRKYNILHKCYPWQWTEFILLRWHEWGGGWKMAKKGHLGYLEIQEWMRLAIILGFQNSNCSEKLTSGENILLLLSIIAFLVEGKFVLCAVCETLGHVRSGSCFYVLNLCLNMTNIWPNTPGISKINPRLLSRKKNQNKPI